MIPWTHLYRLLLFTPCMLPPMYFAFAVAKHGRKPEPPRRPGRDVGRRFTTDSKPKPKLASVTEQEKKWLEESCLTRTDLPGEIVRGNQRLIYFFDLDGKRIVDYNPRRLFVPDSGLLAGVEPEDRYLNPAGQRPRVYIPHNNKSLDLRAYAKDPGKPLYVTEGAKKAACLNKLGFPCVAVEGCWSWRAPKYGYILLPEFNLFELEGRQVIWIPDRDRKPMAILNVGLANDAFARVLEDRGAEPHVVELPFLDGLDKTGLDDLCYRLFKERKDKKVVQRALKELFERTGPYRSYDLTDRGNADRWVSLYSSVFRYVEGAYYVYENGCWVPDTLHRQQQTTMEMFKHMQESARLSGNREWEKRVKAQETKPRIIYVGDLAKSAPTVAARPGEFDRRPFWVNSPNGLLEMPADKNGQLVFREHRPEDMLTKQTSVPYFENAKCPEFLKALDFWTDKDHELQRTIQQLLGLSLTGDTSAQAFIILHGLTGPEKAL